MSDTKSGKDNRMINSILAVIVTTMTFSLFYFILFKDIPTPNKDIALFILGSVTSYVGQVISYYFGSSSGSSKKDDIIKNSLDHKNS